MKRVIYSKFDCMLFDQVFKIKKMLKHGPVGSIFDMNDLYTRLLREAAGRVGPVNEIFFVRSVEIGQCKNIFLESKQLYDFLCDTQVKDVDAAKNCVNNEGIETGFFKPDFNSESYNFISSGKSLSYMIHVPNIRRSIGIVISMFENDKYQAFYTNGDDVGYCPFDQMNLTLKDCLVEDNADFSVTEKLRNLSINIFLYMKCFPDCVIDAPPHLMCDYKKSDKKPIKITAHHSVIDNTGTMPHFRRGFFRSLVSDFYKNKKGQVIFVRSTFVNGKAETVLDNENKQEAFNEAEE